MFGKTRQSALSQTSSNSGVFKSPRSQRGRTETMNSFYTAREDEDDFEDEDQQAAITDDLKQSHNNVDSVTIEHKINKTVALAS